MDLYEAVYVRKSVRSYQKESVEEKLRERILEFASHLFSMDNQKVDYRIIERAQQKKLPGLFSVQAPYYLTIYSEVCGRYEENAGYLMQQIALYIYTKGLGCCFLGNPVCPPEKVGDMVPVITLAFGWPKEKNICRDQEKASRLPMKTLCTIKETAPEEIMEALRAARLAPSSFNNQPWRFVVYQNRVHIFCHCRKKEPDRLKRVDMGIMLANLLLIAEQRWMETELVRLENIAEQEVRNNRYFMTVRFL